MRILLALLLLGACLPAAAATVPLIQQSMLARLIPPPLLHQHLATLVTEQRPPYSIAARAWFEQSYAAQMRAYQDMGRLNQDPQQHDRIRRITARLIRAAAALHPEAGRWPWEIHVVSDVQAFAYSHAGGKLWLSTALVDGLGDDDIAAIISHEVAHILTNLPPAQSLPARRDQEVEADVLGLVLMRDAGFRPQAAIDLLLRTAPAEDRLPESVRAFHPPKHYRAGILRGILPAVLARQVREGGAANP